MKVAVSLVIFGTFESMKESSRNCLGASWIWIVALSVSSGEFTRPIFHFCALRFWVLWYRLSSEKRHHFFAFHFHFSSANLDQGEKFPISRSPDNKLLPFAARNSCKKVNQERARLSLRSLRRVSYLKKIAITFRIWTSIQIGRRLSFISPWLSSRLFAQCKNWWKFLAFSWLFAPRFMHILLSVYFPYWMHSTSLTRVISTSQEWFLRALHEKIKHGILRGKEESPLRNFLSRFARRLGARFLQFSEFYWPTPN